MLDIMTEGQCVKQEKQRPISTKWLIATAVSLIVLVITAVIFGIFAFFGDMFDSIFLLCLLAVFPLCFAGEAVKQAKQEAIQERR